MLNLYVTSTKRKSGKTFISTGLAATMQSLGYSVSVYKPIQTCGIERNGFMQSPDLTYVKSVDPYINTHFTYLYKSNYEPLIAAENEDNPIDIEFINSEYRKISSASDCTVIDGDNGILSPIAPMLYNIDIIKKLKLPVLLVTNSDEDTINDALLSINFLSQSNIDIRGVIINNIYADCDKTLLTSVPRIIEEYTNAKVLGLVENIGTKVTPQDLITSMLNGIDIESVFDVKIEKLDCV